MDATEVYQKKARLLEETSYEMKGKKYELMLELMDEYGVIQLEATNILNGFHVVDYVNKYYRI